MLKVKAVVTAGTTTRADDRMPAVQLPADRSLGRHHDQPRCRDAERSARRDFPDRVRVAWNLRPSAAAGGRRGGPPRLSGRSRHQISSSLPNVELVTYEHLTPTPEVAACGSGFASSPHVVRQATARVAPIGGYTLLELLFVMALTVTIMAAAVPQILASLDRSRGLIAARYLGARVALARTQAVTRNASVALRFEEGPRGISIAVYQDGNRNGVRTADIARQIDRAIEPSVRLSELFPGVEIALASRTPATDAVQLGPTDILSFSPFGTATSGTIYVRGRDGTQWAVRVLGATGRTRVLRYVPQRRDWVDAF